MSGKSRDKHKKKNANKRQDGDFDTFQNSLDAFISEEKQAESEIDALLESSERMLQDMPTPEQRPAQDVRVDEFMNSPPPASSLQPHASRTKQPLSSFQSSGATRHLSVNPNFPAPQPLPEPESPEEASFPLTRNTHRNSSKKRNFTIRQDLKPQHKPILTEQKPEILACEPELDEAPQVSSGPSIVLESGDTTLQQENRPEQKNATQIDESEPQKRSLSEKFGTLMSAFSRPVAKTESETELSAEPEEITNENDVAQDVQERPEVDLVEETARQTQKIHVAHVSETQHAHALREEEKRAKTTTLPQNQLDTVLVEDDDPDDDERNPEDDDDDFEVAVRQARKKLVSAGAMVLLCVVVFFTYQCASSYVFRGGEVATEQPGDNEDDDGDFNGNYVAQQQSHSLPDDNAQEDYFDPHDVAPAVPSVPHEPIAQQHPNDEGPDTTLPELGFADLDPPAFADEPLDDPFGEVPHETAQNLNEHEETLNENYSEEILNDNQAPAGQYTDLPEPYDTSSDFSVPEIPSTPIEDAPPIADDLYAAADIGTFEPPTAQTPDFSAPPHQNPAFATNDFTVPEIPDDNPQQDHFALNDFALNDFAQDDFAQNSMTPEEPYSEPVDVQSVVPNHLALHASAPPVTPPATESFSLPQSRAASSVGINMQDLHPAQEMPQRIVLQGEIQGARMSVPQTSQRQLPLPRRDAAVKSTPAALLASQYNAEDSRGIPQLEQPTFALPGPKYKNDAPIDTPPDSLTIPLDLSELNASPVPPQPSPSFEPDGFRAQTLAEAGSYQATSRNSAQQFREPDDDRQYLASRSRPSSQQVPQQLSQQLSSRPQSDSYRSYEVREGDNLFNIAKRELGSVSRWKEVYQLNRDAIGQDARNLVPGTQIKLP